MNANAIEIRGLKKSFGHFQLGPLDLTVPRGAIYGLIGPNAAGKTTTLDLIMGMGDADADPLYDEAVRVVTETRKASISGVQRRLKIGYNRAARLVEAMEAAGLVGPLQSNGGREVLAPPPA